jgi:hypothetical protein
MNIARHSLVCIAWFTFAAVPVFVQAPDLSRYRQFHLGMTVAAVAQLVGPAPEVRVIHQRPALLQELTWYPRRTLPDDEAVQEVVFTFYDGKLCRLVIEYDGRSTAGLTTDDMVEALSVQYGQASRPRAAIMGSLSRGSHLSDELLATWVNPGHALTLFRPMFLSSFGLVITERRLDSLARRAADEATRLDAQETARRDRDRQGAQNEETRVKLAKARQANKGKFRP